MGFWNQRVQIKEPILIFPKTYILGVPYILGVLRCSILMVETIDFYIPDKNMNKYPKFLDAIQAPLINHLQKAESFFVLICFLNVYKQFE